MSWFEINSMMPEEIAIQVERLPLFTVTKCVLLRDGNDNIGTI